ncbi:MAG: ATP-binding cassette domain-containing protein [Acidimicrobiales bacterium]
MTTATIAIENVSRCFGDIVALDRAAIVAPPGEITVLLGPNGAGKTTAIRLITGALHADAGTVRVFGVDPTGAEGERVRRRCGVVTAKPSLYDRLSGMDNLRYAAELFDLGRGTNADARIVEAADQFGIAESLEHQVGGYSTGMKTRLALARAVLHTPDLLLLDEPTSGLDPESAAAVLDLIRTMTSNGRTVLMCTHLLLEAEGLADRIVVMEAGTTVLSGEPAALSAHYWPDRIIAITAERGDHLDRLADHPAVAVFDRNGETATITLASHASGVDPIPDLIAQLVAAGARLQAVEPYRPSLEDLYFAIRRRRPPTHAPAVDNPLVEGAVAA